MIEAQFCCQYNQYKALTKNSAARSNLSPDFGSKAI